jgi:Ala-tRNA(Pro) deacylase
MAEHAQLGQHGRCSTKEVEMNESTQTEAGDLIVAIRPLTDLLEREGVSYALMPHRHTETASDEAKALGVDPHEVAKTIVLTTERGFLRAVIPASNRLDVHKVRELLDLRGEPHLAHEQDLAAAYPAFELGAVPPVGGPSGDRVAVDRRLANRDSVVIEAGSHDESLRVGTTDLLVLAQAMIGDLCHD